MIPACAVAKENFLERYNPERSLETAARRAIGAALGRNLTYRDANDVVSRAALRLEWQTRLEQVAQDGSLFGSLEDSYPIVQRFRDEMRAAISKGFALRRLPDANFRISHAQKSISVYLKHLWCMGLIKIPAICPVDRVIMTAARAPAALRAWGHVDDINHHKQQIQYLWECAMRERVALAKWELLSFRS